MEDSPDQIQIRSRMEKNSDQELQNKTGEDDREDGGRRVCELDLQTIDEQDIMERSMLYPTTINFHECKIKNDDDVNKISYNLKEK